MLTVCRPLVSTENLNVLVARTIAGVQTVIDIICYVVIQRTIGRDSQVEALILQTSTDTEVYLWHTAAQNGLVFCVNLTIVIGVVVPAVTYVGTLLISPLTLCIEIGNVGGISLLLLYLDIVVGNTTGLVQCIQLALVANDATILPTIELTNFLANLCDAEALDETLGTEAKRGNLVLQCAQVTANLPLQGVVVVTIGCRELETAVLHRCSVHSY